MLYYIMVPMLAPMNTTKTSKQHQGRGVAKNLETNTNNNSKTAPSDSQQINKFTNITTLEHYNIIIL